jgi:hypothetical protein
VEDIEKQTRRKVLKLNNHHSNDSIWSKTAHWHSRPISNCIVDFLEKGEYVAKGVTDELKKCPEYYSKDRTSQCKSMQRVINKHVEPEIMTLAYAVSTGKTVTQFHAYHYCRTHHKLLYKKHLTECSNLDNIQDHAGKKPDHYVEWWNGQKQLTASKEELVEVNGFHIQLLQKIKTLEESHVFVLVDKTSKLIKHNGLLYEPTDIDWIKAPRYFIATQVWWS